MWRHRNGVLESFGSYLLNLVEKVVNVLFGHLTAFVGFAHFLNVLQYRLHRRLEDVLQNQFFVELS